MLTLDEAGDDDVMTFRETLPRQMAWFILATGVTFAIFSATMALWAAGDVPQWASVGLFGALTVALLVAARHLFRYERVVRIDTERGVLTDRKRTVFGTTERELRRDAFREVLAAHSATSDEAWLRPADASAGTLHLSRRAAAATPGRGLGQLLSEWLELPLREQGPG